MTTRVIRVMVDPSGVTSGGRTVNRQLGRMDRNAKGLRSSFAGLTRVAGGLVAALGARELIRTADTFRQIQGQLRLVTDSSEDLLAVQTALLDVAQETRQPLEATVSLYTRLARTTEFADTELVALTKTIGQTIALSQAAPESAQAALFQLGQGFAAGALRGEELNSVLEQTPELANAIARGLGVSVGQLRALGQEGELTAEKIQGALANVADEVDREFQSLPLTVGQSLTQLNNAFTSFVGQVDAGVGVTAALAEAISDFADFVQNDLLGILDRVGLQIERGFIEPLRQTAEQFADVTANIGENSQTLGGFILEALGNIPINIATIVQLATVEIATFIDGIGSRFEKIKSFLGGTVAGILGDEAAELEALAAFNEAADSLDKLADARLENISAILEQREVTLQEIDIEVASLEARRNNIAALSDERRERASKNAVDAEAVKATTTLIEKLQQQTQELALQTALGDGAAEAIQRYRIELQLASIEGGALEENVRAANEALIEQQAIAQAAADRQSNEAVIESLQAEFELIGLTNEQRAIEIELRKLNGEATDEQIEKVRELAEAIQTEKDQIDALGDFFTKARENAQDALAGFLADPLADGLDELPAKFAATLQQLAAEALASELFRILGGLGGGGGGGGGGFLSFIGGLFGGRQNGGSFNAGQPFIAGEGGPGARPELVVPTSSGRVFPAGQTAAMGGGAPPQVNLTTVVVTDPNEIPSGIESPSGERAVMNVIQRNPQALRRIAG